MFLIRLRIHATVLIIIFLLRIYRRLNERCHIYIHVILENWAKTRFLKPWRKCMSTLHRNALFQYRCLINISYCIIVTSLCTWLHYTYLHFSCHCDEIYTNSGMKSATTSMEPLSFSNMIAKPCAIHLVLQINFRTLVYNELKWLILPLEINLRCARKYKRIY